MSGGADAVDWTFAHLELLQKQGVDLRKEMEARPVCHLITGHTVLLCFSETRGQQPKLLLLIVVVVVVSSFHSHALSFS